MQSALRAWTARHPATSALVWRLSPGGPVQVAEFGSDVPRMPASTMKLVTSAGALLQFGASHRFTTTLVTSAPPAAGSVLQGPLYLRGAGDPVLSTPRYGRAVLRGRATPLDQLARALRRRGVRVVRGPIVADESLFDGLRVGPGWLAAHRRDIAPLSAVAVNQDNAGERPGAYVAHPPVASARRLRDALARAGVRHVGPLRAGRAPVRARVVAAVTSPPLAVILRAMNVDSDNFIAETLAKDVGAYFGGQGSTSVGVARDGAVLRSRGILGTTDHLVDGSGLSRSNRVSAHSLVRLISAAEEDHSWGRALILSLPKGGEGTLVHRLRAGVVRDRVRAKTGYIDGVSALAGRVISVHGQRYAFALLMNRTDVVAAKATQDRIVTLLASGAEDGR